MLFNVLLLHSNVHLTKQRIFHVTDLIEQGIGVGHWSHVWMWYGTDLLLDTSGYRTRRIPCCSNIRQSYCSRRREISETCSFVFVRGTECRVPIGCHSTEGLKLRTACHTMTTITVQLSGSVYKLKNVSSNLQDAPRH